MSESIIGIYQEERVVENLILVHPIPGVAERCHLAVATSIDNANQETLNCRVINPSAEDIFLPKDTSIALLSGLPEGVSITEMEARKEPVTQTQEPTVNTISKEGDVLYWDRQGIDPDKDYGLEVLPCQEPLEERKPIELKIDKEGLTKSELARLECFLETHMDLFAKDDGDLGDTDIIRHKIDVGGARPVKSRPNRCSEPAKAALEKHIDTMLKNFQMTIAIATERTKNP